LAGVGVARGAFFAPQGEQADYGTFCQGCKQPHASLTSSTSAIGHLGLDGRLSRMTRLTCH
jgi:hypothetical protein